jgi:hypothetical protein
MHVKTSGTKTYAEDWALPAASCRQFLDLLDKRRVVHRERLNLYFREKAAPFEVRELAAQLWRDGLLTACQRPNTPLQYMRSSLFIACWLADQIISSR